MLCRGGQRNGLAFFGIFDPNDEPIPFGEPLDSREYPFPNDPPNSRSTLVLTAFDLIQNDFLVHAKHVGKQVQVRVERETMKLQPLCGARIGKQNPSRAVRNQNRVLKQVSRLASRLTGSVSLACDSSIGPRFKIALLGHLSAFGGAGNPIYFSSVCQRGTSRILSKLSGSCQW